MISQRSQLEIDYHQLMLWATEQYRIQKEDRKAQSGIYTAITDHAMLRYFERVHGFNLHEVRREIVEGVLEAVEDKASDGKHRVGPWEIVIENGVILTVIYKKSPRIQWKPEAKKKLLKLKEQLNG